jgi:hypothetical protein
MLRNMEKSQRFSSPRISGENAENMAGGNSLQVQDSGRVSFDILAEYNPATLEERTAAIAAAKRMHGAVVLPEKSVPLRPMPRTPTPPAQRPAYIPPNPVQPMAGQPMQGAGASALRGRGRPSMPMNIPGQAGPPIPNPHPDQDSGDPQ